MKVFLSIIGIGVAIWIIYFLYHLYQFLSIPGEVRASVRAETYKGVVENVDTLHSNSKIYVQEINGISDLYIDRYNNDSIFNFLNIGDSIEKKSGEMIITIIKSSGKKKSFHYDLDFK